MDVKTVPSSPLPTTANGNGNLINLILIRAQFTNSAQLHTQLSLPTKNVTSASAIPGHQRSKTARAIPSKSTSVLTPQAPSGAPTKPSAVSPPHPPHSLVPGTLRQPTKRNVRTRSASPTECDSEPPPSDTSIAPGPETDVLTVELEPSEETILSQLRAQWDQRSSTWRQSSTPAWQATQERFIPLLCIPLWDCIEEFEKRRDTYDWSYRTCAQYWGALMKAAVTASRRTSPKTYARKGSCQRPRHGCLR
jgi:hypothetical protein